MTVLRREVALSRIANPETEISCRIAQPRISPIVPALVRHLRISKFRFDQDVRAGIGKSTAHRNPTNSRAMATTTLAIGFPRALSLPNRRWSLRAALSATAITSAGWPSRRFRSLSPRPYGTTGSSS